jgi:hypothetical protein
MDRVAELIADIRRNPARQFSDAELGLLATVAHEEVWAAKALMLANAQAQRFDRCLPLLEHIARLEPTGENVCNLAVGLRSVGRHADAIGLLLAREAVVDRIDFCDLMCSLHARAGNLAEAVRHGDAALKLKQDSAPPAPPIRPRIAAFDPERPARNVIAFSIWGTQPRYLNGALTNAIVIRYLYPGWTARFYTDGSPPSDFLDALRANGAEVVPVVDRPAATHGLFWRFAVEDDDGVDLFLVRDCDSIVTIKERWAVADWLARGQPFHVMRDHPAHCELVLAGLWGAHRGNIGDMAGRVAAFLDGARAIGHFSTIDQNFTRTVLWPIFRDNVTVHDSWFGFGDPLRYDPAFALPSAMHVGQNDWTRSRPR